MKTRYNLSKIMKEAHRLMRVDGFNRSQALGLAWSTAKRNSFYLIIEKWERVERTETIGDIMAGMADSLISFYSTSAYHGD